MTYSRRLALFLVIGWSSATLSVVKAQDQFELPQYAKGTKFNFTVTTDNGVFKAKYKYKKTNEDSAEERYDFGDYVVSETLLQTKSKRS